MKDQIKKVLTRMQELLEKGWTKGELARKADQSPTCFSDHEATCFCMIGALERAMYDLKYVGFSFHHTEQLLKRHLPTRKGVYRFANAALAQFNDAPTTKAADVIEVVKKALTTLTE